MNFLEIKNVGSIPHPAVTTLLIISNITKPPYIYTTFSFVFSIFSLSDKHLTTALL